MQENTAKAATKAVPNRQDIRAKIFASRQPKAERITFYGTEIEIRQPLIGSIYGRPETESDEEAAQYTSIRMLIEYAFVPGTDERVFDDADLDSLLTLPMESDMLEALRAIGRLTGANFTKPDAD